MNSFLRSITPLRFLIALVLIAGGAVVFTGAASPSGADASVRPPAERKDVPDFVMQTLDGQDWRLSDHKGRVVLVNLFATWCPPCRAEMPMLVENSLVYGPKGVDFVGVSLDEAGAKVLPPFVAKYKIEFPVVLPGKGPSIADGISSIPVTVVIDRQGRLAQVYSGMVSEKELKRDLDQLLAEPK